MNKKLFALASVSALAGLVATAGGVGCTVTAPATAPGTDASVDSGPSKLPKSDGGTKKDGGAKDGEEEGEEEEEGGETTVPACFKKDPIDGTKFAYTKAGVKPGACSNKELADWVSALKDLVDAKKLTDEAFYGLASEVSATCAACVYTEEEATFAGVFPKKGNTIIINRAGCFERYKNEACAEAVHQLSACSAIACQRCEITNYVACEDAASKGPCAEEISALATACKDSEEAVENCVNRTKREDGSAMVFKNIETTWIALCGGSAAPDAGADTDGGP
jgi:hypothetical protein